MQPARNLVRSYAIRTLATRHSSNTFFLRWSTPRICVTPRRYVAPVHTHAPSNLIYIKEYLGSGQKVVASLQFPHLVDVTVGRIERFTTYTFRIAYIFFSCPPSSIITTIFFPRFQHFNSSYLRVAARNHESRITIFNYNVSRYFFHLFSSLLIAKECYTITRPDAFPTFFFFLIPVRRTDDGIFTPR